MAKEEALFKIHAPANLEEANKASLRLKFEELFLLQLELLLRKQISQKKIKGLKLSKVGDYFNDFFKTEYASEDVETIGGYLLGHIGHLPERGETLVLDNLTFKVMNADSRQVHMFQVVNDGD